MKQRIRLLLLIPHLGGGGAERVAAILSQRLNPQQFDIHLALISKDGPGAEALPPWVTVHRFGLHRVRQSWLRLIRLIRTERPDVILSSMAHLNFLLLLLKPLLPRQTPIIVRQNSTASTAARNTLDRFLYRQLYPRADAIICQSQAMADDLAAYFQIAQQKLIVLLNPIDIDSIRNQAQAANADNKMQSIEPHQHHLLAIARLFREKGIDLLLDALATLKKNHPRITLSILGAGIEEAQLRLQCKQLRIESQVEFCGFTSRLGLHHAQAHIFVLPSRHEGIPNALLEAAAAGLPIVATPCSTGVAELLLNQPGTWLAASVSAESLAKSIAAALAALNGVRRFDHTFLAPFETKTSIAAYETLITRIAGAAPSPPAAEHHIAMLIPTIDQIGGAERQVLELSKALAARGWRVTLIALSGTGSATARELSIAGVDYLSLDMRKAWIDPRGWLRFRRWARRHKPDILHAHLPHATWFARWTRLICPARIVIDTIHTSSTGNASRQRGYRLSNRLSNWTTCVSQPVANAALSAGIAQINKLSIIANGVVLPIEKAPAPEINPSGAPHLPAPTAGRCEIGDFHWIAVGRLNPVKDYPTLLRAFALLPATARLTIAGSGPEESRLKALAAELQIADRTHLAGFQSNVQPLLANAEAFVLSSLWEGLPVSILEAAANGLPVVATDGAGTREAMIPGETGWVVPVGDVPALAQTMSAIMAMSPNQRQLMGSRGRQFVEEKYALAIVVDQWEQLYRQLLDQYPRHAAGFACEANEK